MPAPGVVCVYPRERVMPGCGGKECTPVQQPQTGEPARIRRAPRVLLLVLFIAGTFMSAMTLAPSRSAEAAIGDIVRTTTNLNLRAGPGTSYGIVLTMPMGAQFKITGSYNKGFYPGRYNGIKGWAYADYLSTTGTSAPAPTAPSSGGGDSSLIGAIRYTTTNLNLRAGPSTGYNVVTTMSSGSAFKITGTSSNGFYPGRFNGIKGWASGDYLSASQPSTAAPSTPTTSGSSHPDYVGDIVYSTTSLNLRSGPGTGYGVVTTMPRGSAFKITGTLRNGFYPGRYNGSTIGWASSDYLSYTDPGTSSGSDSGSDSGNNSGNGSGVVVSSNAGPGSDGVWSEQEIINLIYEAADYYGQSREDMLRVARCESLLNPSLIHPAYNASGLFQFLPSTWATTPYASYYILDPVANAYAASWMWSVGRRGEWVCQ